jgi:outer membrane lipoprotein SlyB
MDITTRLRGKTVEAVMTNGHQLLIRTSDGAEITVVWADGEGRPIKGKPVVSQSGCRLIARGLHELMHIPRIRTHGSA